MIGDKRETYNSSIHVCGEFTNTHFNIGHDFREIILGHITNTEHSMLRACNILMEIVDLNPYLFW